MSIQSTINQGLSMTGLLIGMSPVGELAREKTKRKADIKEAKKNLSKTESITNVALDEYVDVAEKIGKTSNLSNEEKDFSTISTPEYSVLKEAWSAEDAAQKKLTELDPTEANVRNMITRRRAMEEEFEIEQRAKENLEKEHKRIAESNRIRDLILNPGGK